MTTSLLGATSAGAQALAPFPTGSMQGQASFGAWPNVSINCAHYTLGPGVRVLDMQQHIIPTGRLSGLNAHVVFLKDASGNVFRVWLVNGNAPALSAIPQAGSANNCLFGNS